MPQIINETNALSSIGQSLGSGLQSGLEMLTKHKIDEMQRARNAKGLLSLGYTPEEAHNLSGLDPKLLSDAIKQKNPTNINIGKLEEFEQKRKIEKRDKFIDLRDKGLTASRALEDAAQENLRSVEAHEKEFPTNPVTRRLYKSNPEWYSENIQAIEAGYKQIVSLAGSATAVGVSSKLTNAMLRLAEEAKAAIHQPVETQKTILKKMIHSAKKVREEWETIQRFKNEKGEYPLDVENKFNELINKQQSNASPEKSLSPKESLVNNELAVGPKGKRVKSKSTGKIFEWNPKTQDYDIEVR